MASHIANQATQCLIDLRNGDQTAIQRLLPLVYEELRALAGNFFREERADHTLQPTALVHEAFVKLMGTPEVHWDDRKHFMTIAATAMRRILIDHARRRDAEKRGSGWGRISLHPDLAQSSRAEADIIALDDVLSRLAELNEKHARIVELRFFGSLTLAEVAEVMDVSTATVERDWRLIRAWLAVELDERSAT
ncbi:MAG: sigma-70 family RNA polymerase sigma factor [Phycisphaerales bacterium]|nr:sigma-70 family RNA polymerase sigma factor [Phycisphaerales bacterium]